MTSLYNDAHLSGDGTRVAMVTGGNGSIGKAIARQIAEKEGYAVVLVCRNEQKAGDAVSEIRQATGKENVWYELADLSRKSSILALAERWPGRLDVLVNNAAVVPRRRQETPEGIELQLATNVLGYLWMTQAFTEALKMAAPSRVVNVASFYAGDLLVDDLEFKHRRYRANAAYRQSKQANRMLIVPFAEQLKPYQVTVNACHPGTVESTLLTSLGFSGDESPDKGAQTPAWLATGETGGVETGKYFRDLAEFPCQFAEDRTAVEKLYEACLRY